MGLLCREQTTSELCKWMAKALTLRDTRGKRWAGSSAAKYRVSESLSLCVDSPHTNYAPGAKRKSSSKDGSTSSNSRPSASNLVISDGLLITRGRRAALKRFAANTFPHTESPTSLNLTSESDDDDTDHRRVPVAKRHRADLDDQYDADDES
ncbi:Hypp1185 [Branchiostoma lanceolatum]|uniref:Hypp1185 protein n=1 Tax=Branchiostoma lanceolatum TaxID=7740 RepID=A0A8K0EJK0_BRALA|nr:Hypp1185 [Branchiostoma lanceolatum]